MTTPAPSKHAKSASERLGAEALAAAVAEGRVVRAWCLCTRWLLAACDAGGVCGHCGEPMLAVLA